MRSLLVCIVSMTLIRASLAASCLPSAFSSSNCSCITDDVSCEGITSLNIPSDVTLNSLTIHDSPHLRLPNNTFEHLTMNRLSLANNNLRNSDFEIDTFSGLTVDDVDLSNNLLTSIPEAVVNIKNIKGLNVSENPFSNGFQTTEQMKIMKQIGATLTRFSFGFSDFNEWPKELKYFPRLEELNVTGGDFSLMPIDAFYGFERTLKKLSIANTQLRSVPLAFARLEYLTDLHFDHNHQVGDYGMNVPVVPGILHHMGILSLKDDNITSFPKILGYFNNMTKLEMGGNQLKFVSDQSATAIKRVTSLSLRNSSISRIPGALQDMVTLQHVDLSLNGIHALEREDLGHLEQLKTLKLNNNPLLYISDNAFKNSSSLSRIELRNTNLTTVPCAIKNLRLHGFNITIDLTGDDIECTCSLQWLYKWGTSSSGGDVRNQHLSILGNCLTIESTIQQYFEHTLGECPTSTICDHVPGIYNS